MKILIKKLSEKKATRAYFGMRFFSLFVLFIFIISPLLISSNLFAAAGVPKILNFQGRLMNSSGTLLGGSSGTNYCYKFAIYDASTSGTKLWPAGTPTTMTILTRDGVFDAAVGGAGGDTLTYDFQTSDTAFMDVQVSAIGAGSCTSGDESFETLSPRPQIVSAAYAINSGTVGGFTPAQSATGSQIPALTSGAIILGDVSNAGIKATSTNALTFQSGVTGDIQFFSSSNKITSAGALTIAGSGTLVGLVNTGTNSNTVQSATALTVARTGATYALQVDTNTTSSVTGLKITAAAAGAGLAITTIGGNTDENLTFDAKGAGTLSIGASSTGDVLLAGGNGVTGCTITNSTGALACAAGITATTGNVAITTGLLSLGGTTRISNAGVGTFITGTAIGTQTFTTNNIADSGALTIASGSNTALTLNSGTTGAINIGTDASAETINIGNTGAAVKTILIGDNSQANTITIGTASATSVSITDNNWSISTGGAAVFASIGAFTSAGTIDMSTNILTNIGNAGTDFIASTGALTLAGILTANGGISIGTQALTGTTGNIDYTNFDVIGSSGNTDIGGTITVGSGNEIITLATGKIDADALTLATVNANTGTSSTSGLMTSTDGLTLLQGCTDNQLLKWTDAGGWACGDDNTSAGAGVSTIQENDSTVDGSATTIDFSGPDFIVTSSPAGEANISFDYAAVNKLADGITFNLDGDGSPTTDLMSIGISDTSATNGVDGLQISLASSNASGDAIHITPGFASTTTALTYNVMEVDAFSPTNSTGTDTVNGLKFGNLTDPGTTIDSSALNIGSGWDNEIKFLDTTPTMSIADNGTLTLSDGTSTSNDILSIGTALSRGNALVYGNLIKKGLNGMKTLANITDVFVYDTSKDSDSGRWTSTDTNLAYETESKDDGVGDLCNIASDDRCGKSDFPKKTILATTPDSLYIFDAETNSMWMKFTQGGTFALGADTNNNPSSVFALNGVVYVGTNGASATGMYAFDFTNGRMYRYNTTNRVESDTAIDTRNTTTTYATNARTSMLIADNAVNDVHATVLFGSSVVLTNGGPINGATFIAAATDAGLSVVNLLSGRTISYSDVTGDDYNSVFITKRGRLYGLNETQAQVERWGSIVGAIAVDSDNASGINGTPTKLWDETGTGTVPVSLARLWGSAVTINANAPDALEVVERQSIADDAAAGNGDVIYVGHSLGMTEINDVNAADSTTVTGAVKYYTTTYNTPYVGGRQVANYPFTQTSLTTDESSVGPSTFALSLQPFNSPGLVNGVHGTGRSLNNTNQYFCNDSNANDGTCDIDTDMNVALISSNVSIWFRHSTTAPAAGGDALIDTRSATVGGAKGIGYTIEMNTSGQMVYGIQDTAATATYDFSVTSTQSFNDGLWHRLDALNNDTNICLYIDGRLAVACSASVTALTTLDAGILVVGADLTVGTGANFWDGDIDELTISAGGTTVANALTQAQIRKMYLEGRGALSRRTALVTDATAVSSTTIGDSGESWTPNEFVGQIVEIVGGTGANQTRRIISNTTTVLTVSPAWTTTPDTTSDFEMNPETLYGSTDVVRAVGSFEQPLGEARQVYVATDNGSDTGGVTVFSGYGSSSVTDVYHSDAKKLDDAGTEWTGTDRDDMQALGISYNTVVFGSLAGTWTETRDIDLQTSIDRFNNDLNNLRLEAVHDTLGGSGFEFGGGGGADLAEYYYSNSPLQPGDVVAIQPDQPAGIDKSTNRYQKNLLGVVSTKPGITLGSVAENAYPIALSGRIPVKITDENGTIHVGDLLTSSSRPGYAMRATSAGAIIGRVINEPESMTSCDTKLPDIATAVGDGPGVTGQENTGSDEDAPHQKAETVITTTDTGPKCGYAMLFAGLGESLGKNVEVLAKEFNDIQNGQVTIEGITTPIDTQSSIMNFLRASRDDLLVRGDMPESIFTDRIAAGLEILTPTLYVDSILSTSDDGVVFGSPVEFTIPPIFNKDTAGFAIIKQGDRRVRINFDQPYATTPVVTSNMTFEVTDNIDDTTATDLFNQNIQYIVTAKNEKGFTILINKNAPRNIRFSWLVFGVRDAKVIESLVDGLEIQISYESSNIPEGVLPPQDNTPSGDTTSSIVSPDVITTSSFNTNDAPPPIDTPAP